jgi:hypothetical protein
MPSCARLDGRGRPSLRVHGRGWRPSPPRPQVLQHCGRVGFEIAELRSAGRARAPVPTCSREGLETVPTQASSSSTLRTSRIEMPSCARLDGRGRPSLRVRGRGWRPVPAQPPQRVAPEVHRSFASLRMTNCSQSGSLRMTNCSQASLLKMTNRSRERACS